MKRYLITGASRGIGRAIAEHLAADGIHLLLHGRDEAALAETREAVTSRGARAEVLTAALDDAEQLLRVAELAAAEPLDGLVNNGGVAVVKPLEEISLDEWQRTIAVNVTAPFVLTQRLAARMSAGAAIVNILSIAAKTGFAGWSAYCMSKFALEGFSQSLREELRPRGIRVINIYPAATATDIWQSVTGEWPRDKMMSADDVAAATVYAISQRAEVLIENITIGHAAGSL